jgi:adenine deaminase
MTALKAMTIWPAYQYFEEKNKGSIETGKLADFVILDKDPTSVDPETLDTLKVIQTIKEGNTVYLAGKNKVRTYLCRTSAASTPSPISSAKSPTRATEDRTKAGRTPACSAAVARWLPCWAMRWHLRTCVDGDF